MATQLRDLDPTTEVEGRGFERLHEIWRRIWEHKVAFWRRVWEHFHA